MSVTRLNTITRKNSAFEEAQCFIALILKGTVTEKVPHPPPTTLIYSLFSLYFCNELNYLILEEKKRIRVVILNKKFHKIRFPVLKRGSEMTEMSNFCLKQSQGLMTSAAHPYPNFPWGSPSPSPPGQSDDSFHIEPAKNIWKTEQSAPDWEAPHPNPPPPPR